MAFLIIKRKILVLICLMTLISTGFIFYFLQIKPIVSNYNDMEFRVVIDPGHGSIDTGTHYNNQIYEKDINLKIAKILEKELLQYNIRPILTRTDDSLYQKSRRKDIIYRPQLANKMDAKLFVSLHVNSFPSRQPKGSQIFYRPNSQKSRTLGKYVSHELEKLRSENKREVNPGDYYVLNKTNCPAILIEMGFLSNPEDRSLLTEDNYLQELSKAISEGIINYFRDDLSGNLKYREASANKPPERKDYGGYIKVNKTQKPKIYYLSLKDNKPTLVSRDFIYPTGVYLNKNLTNLTYTEFLVISCLNQLSSPPPNLWSILPPKTLVESINIDQGKLTINFSKDLLDNFQGGAELEKLLLVGLKKTLLTLPEIKGIMIKCNGEPISTIGGHLNLQSGN